MLYSSYSHPREQLESLKLKTEKTELPWLKCAYSEKSIRHIRLFLLNVVRLQKLHLNTRLVKMYLCNVFIVL